MRGTFLSTLQEVAERDHRVMLLTGDLGYTVLEPFEQQFPDRFFNVGVAEQNMVGVELVSEKDGHTPDPDLAKAVVGECRENGLIVLSCGLYGNVIRILAPLTASDAIVDEGLNILEQSLVAVAHRSAA